MEDGKCLLLLISHDDKQDYILMVYLVILPMYLQVYLIWVALLEILEEMEDDGDE